MYKKETLNNGIRVVTEKIAHVKSAAIGVWVKCGSRVETKSQQGSSHFIEHMLFKGTSRRSARDIAEELESVGGILNAFTGREFSCYYARVLSEHIALAIDILKDMLTNSTFNEEEIEKEKNVVLEEIKMYEDTPDEYVHDLFSELVWDNHPLGNSILGKSETIKKITRKGILNYFTGCYVPKNMVISVSGNVEHGQIIEMVDNMTFNGVKAENIKNNYSLPHFKKRLVYKSKELEQTHLCIGTEGLSQNDKNIYTLMLLNNILGGGVSSRLFQRIREELGMAYSVYSYLAIYKDKGLFTIYAGVSPKMAKKVINEIVKIIREIQNKGVSPEELERAKAQIKGSLYIGMESTSNRMSRLGRTELCHDRVITVDEVVENIEKVNCGQVQELSKKMLKEENLAVLAYGPSKYKFEIGSLLN